MLKEKIIKRLENEKNKLVQKEFKESHLKEEKEEKQREKEEKQREKEEKQREREEKQREREEQFESDYSKLLEEFNSKFIRVKISGKAKILKIIQEDGSKFRLPEIFQNLMSYADFHNQYAEKRITDPFGNSNGFTYEWIKDSRSNKYNDGIDFNPRCVGPGKMGGKYNTYSGMSVEPDSTKSCEKIKQMVKDMCINHPIKDYYFLEKYLAHMMKKPWELPLVAIVIRGNKGTGKGTLIEKIIKKIWSQHQLVTGHIEQVTGKFNSATMNTILVYLAECSWGGYKDQDSVLKNMITNLDISIEKKGQDPFEVKNYSRVFISSNEEWVVPATSDDRRYFFLNVSDKWSKNFEYWSEIYNEIDNGGVEAYLHYLMNEVDIEDFKPFSDLPKENISMANDMIQRSYSSIERFLNSWIEDGALLTVDNQGKIITVGNPKYSSRVRKTDFYEKYSQFCTKKVLKEEDNSPFYRKVCDLLNIKITKYDGVDCFSFPKNFDELKINWDKSMKIVNKTQLSIGEDIELTKNMNDNFEMLENIRKLA